MCKVTDIKHDVEYFLTNSIYSDPVKSELKKMLYHIEIIEVYWKLLDWLQTERITEEEYITLLRKTLYNVILKNTVKEDDEPF